MRIGHPVHQQNNRIFPARRASLGHAAPVKRIHLQSRTLMHRLRINRRCKLACIADLRRHLGCSNRIPQPVGRVFGDNQTMAHPHRVLQCLSHRMNSEQPDRLRTFGAALFVLHPFGLGRITAAALCFFGEEFFGHRQVRSLLALKVLLVPASCGLRKASAYGSSSNSVANQRAIHHAPPVKHAVFRAFCVILAASRAEIGTVLALILD